MKSRFDDNDGAVLVGRCFGLEVSEVVRESDDFGSEARTVDWPDVEFPPAVRQRWGDGGVEVEVETEKLATAAFQFATRADTLGDWINGLSIAIGLKLPEPEPTPEPDEDEDEEEEEEEEDEEDEVEDVDEDEEEDEEEEEEEKEEDDEDPGEMEGERGGWIERGGRILRWGRGEPVITLPPVAVPLPLPLPLTFVLLVKFRGEFGVPRWTIAAAAADIPARLRGERRGELCGERATDEFLGEFTTPDPLPLPPLTTVVPMTVVLLLLGLRLLERKKEEEEEAWGVVAVVPFPFPLPFEFAFPFPFRAGEIDRAVPGVDAEVLGEVEGLDSLVEEVLRL